MCYGVSCEVFLIRAEHISVRDMARVTNLECGGLVYPEPAYRRRASKGRRFGGVSNSDGVSNLHI
jgi:hypothetical protein